MAAGNGLKPKLNYKSQIQFEPFFTGGVAKPSSDGKLLACACADQVKVIDITTGAVKLTMDGDSDAITALCWSPNGHILYTASRSLQQKAWRVETGEVLRAWKGHRAPVLDMCVDPSGALLATGGADRTVRVWDTQAGYATHVFSNHSGVVLRVLWLGGQMCVVSTTEEGEVLLWDLMEKSCRAKLQGHMSGVAAVDLAADGSTLVTGGRDKVVITWDTQTATKLSTVPVFEAVEGLAVLPSTFVVPGNPSSASKGKGKKGTSKPLLFATGGDKGVVKIWRSDTGSCVYEQPGVGPTGEGGQFTDLALLRHPLGLLATTVDARIMIWEHSGDDGEEVDVVGVSGAALLTLTRQLIGNNDEVTDVRLVGGAHDTATHVVVATNSPAMHCFDLSSSSCSATLAGHSEAVLSIDAKHLPGSCCTIIASGSKDSGVRLWKLPEGTCIGVGEGHLSAVTAVAFSQKTASFLVSAGADKIIKVWDIAPMVTAIESGSASSGQLPEKLLAIAATAAHDKDINAAAVAPNDQMIATASQDKTVKIWQMPSLVLAMTLRGHRRGVWGVVFSRVDKVVVTGSGDKTVKLWSVTDGSCLRTFEGHTASVLRVDFVTMGTQLVSVGADGCLKLWNVRGSECVKTLDCHEDKVWALDVTNDGAVLATGGGDGRVIVWNDCTDADAEAAAEAAGEMVLKEQQLMNALQDEEYQEAAQIAFELRHPGRLLKVVNRVVQQDDEQQQQRIWSGLLASCSTDDLKTWLTYIREWNTNSRHCAAAHSLLNILLKKTPPKVLLEVSGIGDLLDGVLSYSRRHFKRIERLSRSACVLDYMMDHMSVLTNNAEHNDDDTQDGGAATPHGNGLANGGTRFNDSEDDDADDDGRRGHHSHKTTNRHASGDAMGVDDDDDDDDRVGPVAGDADRSNDNDVAMGDDRDDAGMRVIDGNNDVDVDAGGALVAKANGGGQLTAKNNDKMTKKSTKEKKGSKKKDKLHAVTDKKIAKKKKKNEGLAEGNAKDKKRKAHSKSQTQPRSGK